ncbi:MAG: two-component regulator propeller domain-containing protein [Kofleriaceae bacterium]
MGRHAWAHASLLTLVGMATATYALAAPGDRPGAGAGTATQKSVQRMVQPLDFDRLGYAEGLPQSNIQAIIQDDLGFLWFGTQDGLARYDGISMRVYRPVESDPSSISGGYITAITLDKTGKLWIGTDNKGVDLYDPATDKFTRFLHGQDSGSLSSEGVNAILKDKQDRVWFAMSGGGLNRFDPTTGKFADYLTAPLDASITALDSDGSSNLWLGTADAGVIRWNPTDNKAQKYSLAAADSTVNPAVNAIKASSSGKIWIGTEGEGVFVLDPTSGKITRFRHDPANLDSLSHDHISVLFEDRQGGIWVGTNNGLNRMDASGKVIQYHHEPDVAASLIYPWVTSVYQDAGNVMWIGGKAGGLCKFDPLRLKFGHHRLRSDTANSFYEDRDGTLWVGTYHGGLYKYDRANQRVTTYRSLGPPGEAASVQLDSAWISSLHRDRHGTLWIGTRELGLIAFDTTNETYKQYRADAKDKDALPNDSIWDLWEDDKGVIWLATWGGGIIRLDPRTGRFTEVTMEDAVGLTSNHLYQFYQDPLEPRILWIGSAKGGLIRFDTAAGTATNFAHKADNPKSLSSDDVLSIYRDANGTLWVGTYGGGLNRLDPKTGAVERFTTGNSGLTSDVVLGILADPQGQLWLSTNGGGLLQFNPETKKFLVYKNSDGVQDNEFGQGSYMQSKSGEMFFGGVGGFNAFFPKNIVRDAYIPPIVVTGFKVFTDDKVTLDQPIWTLPKLEISHSDSFELTFAALSYAAPSKNRYAYKLEGFDDKFIETDRPYATYTKLEGGTYQLRVRAANHHGAWNETGITLDLHVTPPLWRTWPAFLLYVLILAAAVYLLFRMQRAKVRRIEREGRLAVVERDLELTGAVQSGFLPQYDEIHIGSVRIHGFYRAADACSGDWWWHELLPGGRHVVLVGDVTGHGPGPAMVTAAVATALRVLIANGLTDLEAGLDVLNGVVLNVAKGKYHMTMAALELDESTGRWVLHNAGAPPIFSLNQGGKHNVHFCPGSPLGTAVDFETGRTEGTMDPQDRILIYTDGIPEITLPSGGVLGMRRFAQMYESTRTQDLKEAAGTMIRLADHAQGAQRQADDWTFTLIEWNGRPR